MIQRIQTVYLSLAAGCSAGSIFLVPLAVQTSLDNGLILAVRILAGLVALGSLAAVFLYANRERQRQWVVMLQYAGLLFVLLDILVVVLGEYTAGLLIPNFRLWGFLLLPMLTYLLLSRARRGIDHDIKLIRSMDRIR